MAQNLLSLAVGGYCSGDVTVDGDLHTLDVDGSLHYGSAITVGGLLSGASVSAINSGPSSRRTTWEYSGR